MSRPRPRPRLCRITSIQLPSSGTATCPVLNSARTSSCSDNSLTVSSYRLPASVRPEYLKRNAGRRPQRLNLTLPEISSAQPSIHAWPVLPNVPISQIRKLRPQGRGNWAPEPNVGTKCARPNLGTKAILGDTYCRDCHTHRNGSIYRYVYTCKE